MPANTNPIWPITANINGVKITTASALVRSDGSAANAIGTDQFLLFTAGANGSLVQRVRFIPVASAANVTSVATVLRLFLSSVNSGTPTASNTMLIAEISVPAIAASNATAAVNYYEIPLNLPLASGDYLLVSQHTAQTTNQSWQALAIGGDY